MKREGNFRMLLRNLRKQKEQETNKQALVLSNVSNSVCTNCGKRGYKTDLTDNSYACKKCLTWWANGC
jgi:acetyl-CoA carboxylase beta subunit